MRVFFFGRIIGASHSLSSGPSLPQHSWPVRHDQHLPAKIKLDQICGGLMLILDQRPPSPTDDQPWAKPEQDGDSVNVAEERKRRLEPKELRLKEGAVLLLSMGD